MNILLSPFFLFGVFLGGALIPARSVEAQLPEMKDPELEPLVVNAHAYAPHREAFENCWKKIRQENAFDPAAALGSEETPLFRYESARHHFRSILKEVSRKTFAFLTHFDEAGDRPDVLVFISQTEDFTADHLRQCLEYLPLGVPAGVLSTGYPLKPTGDGDYEVACRDVFSFGFRMAAPFVRSDFTMPPMPGQARDPKPNTPSSKP